MTTLLWTPLGNSLMITAFVAVMMITVEYIGVMSRGAFQRALSGSQWVQYVAAGLLGALPGCLGPFAVVALYTHRAVSFGAVVTAMIATSGDEAFVMFAMFPGKALWLTLGLAAVGIVVGPLADLLARTKGYGDQCADLVIHEADVCRCFPAGEILAQWRRPGWTRTTLSAAMLAFIAAVAVGLVGPPGWNWVRVTLLAVGILGGFVVSTVPDHFLNEHLWRHSVQKHVPRIFAWTLGVLIAVAALNGMVDLESFVRENVWGVLGVAGLIGIIPESGPHLVFVTLFSQGNIPVSVLIASSIVQDGHGMLPLLAESRRDFLRIKAINLVVGLAVGAMLLALGH